MRTLILMATTLGLTTAAMAQTQPAAADGLSFENWAEKARERLMALDADHDGKISKDEFAARAAMMSGRRDGVTPPQSADASGARHDGSRMFDRFDTNQDGFLDTTEVNAVLARRFARMDRNHDGMLAEDERHAMRGGNASEQ